eukprot:TRINITY_DN3965_c0_g1_i1.p1 TRINITY_DN3965_c0_g1~~TRINITY_DN3965_c0_g1_i1.p1  ORF type:complete len:353 (-),score=69.60 TRINITY_DN3965_c0_g1_i1:49-1107(-)
MNLQKDTKNSLLYINFNQDFLSFTAGTDDGFQIFDCENNKKNIQRAVEEGTTPTLFSERYHRDFKGGIGIVEILFRTNILALVGGGKKPYFPPNKIIIWDDFQSRCLIELEFLTPVLAARLRRDKIVSVLLNKIVVYNFADLKRIRQIDTPNNPRGLIALSPDSENYVLAYPGPKTGEISVETVVTGESIKTWKAHESEISAIALSLKGSKLATASVKGTLIRVWDTATGNKIAELRRGTDSAVIGCLNFNHDESKLCVSSNKGTVHIFSITQPELEEKREDKGMWGYMPSFKGKWRWSHAQFHISEPYSICAFGENNTILVVSSDGTFHKYKFDEKDGGDATEAQHDRFLK